MMELNADLGEGMGTDEAIMPYIQSCNIACGGHTGNDQTMQGTIRLALQHKVKIGAHPSYPDRVNFGRISIKMDKECLKANILDQIQSLDTLIKENGGTLNHIKPHGALYNDAAKNPEVAELMVELVRQYYSGVALFVPFKSVIEDKARTAGIDYRIEGFADRNYFADGSLIPRQHPKAVLTSITEVLAHVGRMAEDHVIQCLDGTLIPVQIQTLCVHGDNPKAVQLAKAISSHLQLIRSA
ncbi:5-oxoprolinase subunit PxpA [Pararhodonellum marinum]|uniref:5-oxoprolinase subunit PxpA n=1 Tax=Pararhodonellum marinum TaxID=2755358 RepID=UPI00188EEE49|nr:5-oxoprolinase subunit PxpA [Pararhodonellum marinum]